MPNLAKHLVSLQLTAKFVNMGANTGVILAFILSFGQAILPAYALLLSRREKLHHRPNELLLLRITGNLLTQRFDKR
jgi:hypothetical protein